MYCHLGIESESDRKNKSKLTVRFLLMNFEV